jgi:hypothetical protein
MGTRKPEISKLAIAPRHLFVKTTKAETCETNAHYAKEYTKPKVNPRSETKDRWTPGSMNVLSTHLAANRVV